MNRLHAEEWIIGSALMVMVMFVAAQVTSRYVLHASLSFSEEVVRYLFVWISFIGAAAALTRGSHLAITGVSPLFPTRVRRLLRFVRGAGACVFTALVFFHGVRVVLLQARTGQATAALGMPMWLIGLAVPLGALLLVIRLAILAGRGERR